MEVRSFLLTTVGFLGFFSGLLGFVAEVKKITESDITRVTSTECVHSRSPSMVLGLLAAIALLIAQILSNLLGGCVCCDSGHNGNSRKKPRTWVAISLLTLSWVTFSIAFFLLLAGASVNDKHNASGDSLSTGCYIAKAGVFTGAAFASMMTAVLGIAYNFQVTLIHQGAQDMLLRGVNNLDENNNMGNISIVGRPIFPGGEQAGETSMELENSKGVHTRTLMSNESGRRKLQMMDVAHVESRDGHNPHEGHANPRKLEARIINPENQRQLSSKVTAAGLKPVSANEKGPRSLQMETMENVETGVRAACKGNAYIRESGERIINAESQRPSPSRVTGASSKRMF